MDTNTILARHLHIISSDIVLARCALHYCTLTIDAPFANGLSEFFSAIRHHSTSALAVHTCRIFEFSSPANNLSSFFHVSRIMRKQSDTIKVLHPQSLANYMGVTTFSCNRCVTSCDFTKPTCQSCIAGHAGWCIAACCSENAELIKTAREFRDKWVAHAEIPNKPIRATYATFERLLTIAEDFLLPFSLYIFPGNEFRDVIEKRQSWAFFNEMKEIMETLEAARVLKQKVE